MQKKSKRPREKSSLTAPSTEKKLPRIIAQFLPATKKQSEKPKSATFMGDYTIGFREKEDPVRKSF
jgi:hypothetical protein